MDNQKGIFSEEEEKVIAFWEKQNIFKKSVEKDAPNGSYIFYDGPPFITGLPHYATLLPSIAKDVIPRYFTMKGYRVDRVWGWDCHGLPAENKVEEKLELKNKKDIEELGVDKFVNACFDYVRTGSEQWKWYIDRIGRWVDLDNAYKTMDLNFMESVIWAFKELHGKGLIYEGYRTSLHCPRCATPLSKFEITMDADSYKDIEEEAIVVRFKLENGRYLLSWTTTPWTIPGNLALAVGKKIEYKIIEFNKEEYILSPESIELVFSEKEHKEKGTIKGEELLGLKYIPVFNLKNKELSENKNAFKVYHADFVNTEEGTGVVHIAPNFGEDDFELGKKIELPVVDLMDENGVYTTEAGDWNGLYFKKAGKKVIEDLQEDLLLKHNYIHSYPFCYRCKTQLIHKTQKAWYLKISEIREAMIKNNEKINWVPDHFKEGRFKYNLENAPDWCLSRSRYFGSPVPVWKCSCGEVKVIGSVKELEQLSNQKVTDLHRPFIDNIVFDCEKCGQQMNRIPEVLDCWFESGSMPFGQFHYPFENKEKWEELFPSDFIIEYTGQLRGWFYYLHVLSTALFNDVAFKNVIVTGVLAGNDGRKMSKSLGNYPDPKETLDKYGSDALRIYFMSSPIMMGGDMNIIEEDIQNALRKNVMLFWNVVNFYEMFSTESEKIENDSFKAPQSENEMDNWIISRLNETITGIEENLKNYNMPASSAFISSFIDDLSTWYIRRSRDRFKSKNKEEAVTATKTTQFVLWSFSKAVAPVMPFIAERVWQKITGNDFKDGEKSVHLTAFPTPDKNAINEELLKDMKKVREVVSLALKQRVDAGVKVRQPLGKLFVKSDINKKLLSLIQEEVNVKEVVIDNKIEQEVQLDLNITPELKEEGDFREVARTIQTLRKQAGLIPEDKITLYYQGEGFENFFEKWKENLKKETGTEKIKKQKTETPKAQKNTKINNREIEITIE
jgi:isoleucyl-tRNA synthetase